MLLRSGLANRRRSGGSSPVSDEAAARPRLLKRKSSGEVDAAPIRRVRKSPPASSLEELPGALHLSKVEAEVLQPTPAEAGSAAGDDSNNVDDSSDELSVAEMGVKVFPDMPPQSAANTWIRFVNNAKACINHYNKKYQADFVYKHVLDCGLLLLREPNGRHYYHINFHAQDKKGHSQRFFGEIRVCVAPKEEDVTCCSPVSTSDAGGKRIQTVEEAMKYKFPTWGTAGKDEECCYGCYPEMKHPKGTCYVAGHVADPRQYFVPDK